MQAELMPARARGERRQPRRAGRDRVGGGRDCYGPRLRQGRHRRRRRPRPQRPALARRRRHRGRIGQVTDRRRGPGCRCGSRGCPEAFAGAEAILEPLRRRHGDRLTLRQVVVQATGRRRRLPGVIADAGRALGRAAAGRATCSRPSAWSPAASWPQAGDLLLEPLREAVGRSAIAGHPRGPDPRGRPRRARRGPGRRRPRLRESQRFVAEPERVPRPPPAIARCGPRSSPSGCGSSGTGACRFSNRSSQLSPLNVMQREAKRTRPTTPRSRIVRSAAPSGSAASSRRLMFKRPTGLRLDHEQLPATRHSASRRRRRARRAAFHVSPREAEPLAGIAVTL